MKFTKTEIAKAVATTKANGGKEVMFWDAEMPGFGLRAQNGKGRWCAQFRVGLKQRRVSLGKITKVDLADAQNTAKQLFGDVARKVDPTVARKKASAAASKMFEDAVEDFIVYQSNKVVASYLDAIGTSLRERFKCLHGLALDTIERSTVAVALRNIAKKNGPVSADRRRAHLLKFFNWAIGEGLCAANPADHTNLHAGDSESRERVLAPGEMKKIWRALPDNSFGRILRLLVLTGQRRTEIGSLKWSEVDLSEGVIHLSGARTKNGLLHDIPLSKLALSILKSCPRIEGRDYIFGTGKGAGGFSGWSKDKATLNDELDVESWTLHDLRRTASTWMNEIDVLPHIVEAILNHVTGDAKKGVAGTYNHAKYNPQKREALEKFAKHIVSVVGPAKPPLKLVA